MAPFGGTKPVLTSNPFAFGAPTDTIPIIVDVATSMVTNGKAAKMYREGQKFETNSLLRTRRELNQRSRRTVRRAIAGSILPLGGAEAGHKGYDVAHDDQNHCRAA